MRRRLIAMLAVLAAGMATPVAAQSGAGAVDAVARRYQLAGEVLVARGNRILLDRGYGTVTPAGGKAHKAGAVWRLASISKQVTAAVLLAQPTGNVPRLDEPLARSPSFNGSMFDGRLGMLTLRQLLTHHSGLANPDTTPTDATGVPAFYAANTPDLAFCLGKPAVPGSPFAYNNCDYIVAAEALITVGSPDDFWPRGMRMARPGEFGIPGFIGGKPEPRFQLSSYGAAGGLLGTARAVFNFDRSLMTGKLLSTAARDALWKPEGNGSYQALGQWVFPGQLKGCAKPKRIVQRDGEILGVQTRNFIFPDDDLVVIVFTNRSSDDFSLGEVWEGKGFVFDLLSAAACP